MLWLQSRQISQTCRFDRKEGSPGSILDGEKAPPGGEKVEHVSRFPIAEVWEHYFLAEQFKGHAHTNI